MSSLHASLKSIGSIGTEKKSFRHHRTAYSLVSSQIWPKFEINQALNLKHVLITCKYQKDQIKNNQEKVDTIFPIISLWGYSLDVQGQITL